MEKQDFGATQRFLIKHAPELAIARKYVTPATVGSAITALAIAVSWLVTAQHDIHTAQNDIRNLNETVSELRVKIDAEKQNDVPQAVTASRVDDIADQVDRLQQWRDKIEGIAEAPPHARRRRN